MTYDKPITVQKQNPNTEEWEDLWRLHAHVNKTRGGQTLSAGADQFTATLDFTVRYFSKLEEVKYNPQPYRILYRGHTFKLADYDDYMERHQTVKLVGEAYG